ncbi:hypothetical protein [Usitatibacter palustris]|uniref:Uncharacterized protein n=1 Tax=Usitatibacter palustris TaxID=2732487 RepID=A0A6M4H9G9_9PROT|nr:hypothetical protein [Usitatibacter palustris]QJR16206.1 hypothetical protein DSM104440_03035 [Usitatibacter palustris]
MESPDDEWELTPEVAHPNAKRLLKDEFYWDICDEDSPFGNDTGADTLEFYREWIEESDDDEDFLHQLFDDWEVDWERAEAIPDAELSACLEEEHFDILTYDDVLIAVAFAQLVLEGNTSRDIAALAIRSLKRQALPEVIEFRGWSDPGERKERCARMLEVMQSAS